MGKKVIRLNACPYCKKGIPRFRLLNSYLHAANNRVYGWCYNVTAQEAKEKDGG